MKTDSLKLIFGFGLMFIVTVFSGYFLWIFSTQSGLTSEQQSQIVFLIAGAAIGWINTIIGFIVNGEIAKQTARTQESALKTTPGGGNGTTVTTTEGTSTTVTTEPSTSVASTVEPVEDGTV